MRGSGMLLHELTRGEAATTAASGLVVLPVGATEQHGPHLPLGTDFLLVEHVARASAVAASSASPVVVAPTLPFGSSHHHLPFGGTLSLGTGQYLRALTDLADSLVESGFSRIFILNGHGGNHELAQLVARDVALRRRANVAAASYWNLAGDVLGSGDPDATKRIPGHAGLFETSLMMAVRPDLVREPPAEPSGEALSPATLPYRAEIHGAWQGIGGFTDRPAEASAERGRWYLEAIVDRVSRAFAEFAAIPVAAG